MSRPGPRPGEPAPSELADPWLDTRLLGSPPAGAEAGADEAARLGRHLGGARAVLGIALLLAEALAWRLEGGPGPLRLALAAAYAGLAVWGWAAARGPLGPRRWRLALALDLGLFTLLAGGAGGGHADLAALMVLPVLAAAVQGSRRESLAAAAAASLLLLAAAVRTAGPEAVLALNRAGLAGAGLFLVALLAHELARRLARERRSAQRHLALAREQAQLNRLVLEELDLGVVVVDDEGRVRASNPAAQALLPGLEAAAREPGAGPARLPAALEEALASARREGRWPAAAAQLRLPGGPPLRLRWRRTRPRPAGPRGHHLLILEDLRAVQARQREERLAAMGRFSAGIAHEIRNPLGAILQANALLAEGLEAGQREALMAMVAANAERIKRIVDDVMEVAADGPSAQALPALPLDASLPAMLAEWEAQPGRALPPGAVEWRGPQGAGPAWVRFDPEHLRRVLLNLLDNGWRHGRRLPGSLCLSLQPEGAEAWLLEVGSDGEPIAAEVEPHLFEPFFSTRSRGTGLGLYICRELCERHGARIDYLRDGPEARHRNRFRVRLQAQPAPPP